MKLLLTAGCIALFLSACGQRQLEPDAAINCDRCEEWNQVQVPFRIHGNTWYVGTAGLASILVETADGLILLDAALPQSAALIDANIRKLGFDTRDIEAILVSHAHFDHVGGVAALQRYSGATVYTSPRGREPLVSGRPGQDDPQFVANSDANSFPRVQQVIAVNDGEIVSVGGVDIKAVFTPGHTPGGTSWTWQSCALNTCYDVVYADTLSAVSAPGFGFASSGAANDIITSAGIIGDLDCDIFLAPHPVFFGMQDKLERKDSGNPFINNLACVLYAESMLAWLEQRLNAER